MPGKCIICCLLNRAISGFQACLSEGCGPSMRLPRWRPIASVWLGSNSAYRATCGDPPPSLLGDSTIFGRIGLFLR